MVRREIRTRPARRPSKKLRCILLKKERSGDLPESCSERLGVPLPALTVWAAPLLHSNTTQTAAAGTVWDTSASRTGQIPGQLSTKCILEKSLSAAVTMTTDNGDPEGDNQSALWSMAVIWMEVTSRASCFHSAAQSREDALHTDNPRA
ncbi:hypothetical protein EYF80_045680 [Liparis tanakae]|uniref:Uncharacterized protein n=1 Tax=Liparis tanakae TaxID=230148 RepID=A0A4Z2FSJ7_9TELE|nr:hypothetical protein EYF80_045680 [Liparis tanakae]